MWLQWKECCCRSPIYQIDFFLCLKRWSFLKSQRASGQIRGREAGRVISFDTLHLSSFAFSFRLCETHIQPVWKLKRYGRRENIYFISLRERASVLITFFSVLMVSEWYQMVVVVVRNLTLKSSWVFLSSSFPLSFWKENSFATLSLYTSTWLPPSSSSHHLNER